MAYTESYKKSAAYKRRKTAKKPTTSSTSSSKKKKKSSSSSYSKAYLESEAYKRKVGVIKPTTSKTKSSSTKRVVQNGAIYAVNTNTGGFTRVGLTVAESQRRARIQSGQALAKDLIPRYSSNQTQLARGRQILTRTSNLQYAQAKNKEAQQSFGPRKSRLPKMKQSIPRETQTSFAKKAALSRKNFNQISTVLQKYGGLRRTPQTMASKLSVEQINHLQRKADAINKRGEKLDKREEKIINFINKLFKEKSQSKPKSKLIPKPLFPNLQKSTTVAGRFFAKELTTLAATTTVVLPQRLAQVVDKSLFIGQTAVHHQVRGDFKRFWTSLLTESNRTQPIIQQSLRYAFTDPRTYIYALAGARSNAPSNLKPSAILSRAPKSKSKLALSLKNKVFADKKGNLFKVGKKGEVFKASTRPLIFAKSSGRSLKNKPITKGELRKGVTRAVQKQRAREAKQAASPFDVKVSKQFQQKVTFKKGVRTIDIREVPVIEVTAKTPRITVSKSGKVKRKFLTKSENTALKNQLAAQSRGRARPTGKKQGRAQDLQAIVFKERADGSMVRLQLTRVRGKQVIKRQIMSKNQAVKDPSFKNQQVSKTGAKAQAKQAQAPQSSQQITILKSQIKTAKARGDKRAVRFAATKLRLRKQYEAKLRKVREGQQKTATFNINAEVKGFMKDLIQNQSKLTGKPRKVTITQKTKVVSKTKSKLTKKQEAFVAREAKKAVQRNARTVKTKTRVTTTTKTRLKPKSLNKSNIKALADLARKSKVLIKFTNVSGLALSARNALALNQKQDVAIVQRMDEVTETVQIITTPVRRMVRAKTTKKPTLRKPTQPKKTISAKPRKLVRKVPRSRRTTKPKEPLKPIELKIPKLPKELRSVKNPKGFDVYIKTKRGYKRQNTLAYSARGADKFGKFVANNSTARSYVVVGVVRKAQKLPKYVATTSAKLFRRPKKKSKLKTKTIVEKRKYAINTAGERRGLRAAQFLRGVAKRQKKKKPSKKAKKRPTKRKKNK